MGALRQGNLEGVVDQENRPCHDNGCQHAAYGV